MRGVIMSIEGNKAVLLTQGGDFKQIRNKNYNIGDKVKVRANYAARIGTIAAALAVFAIGGGASYFIPASYVSVDINPSFLMTLNVYNKVINVEPLNGEAETLLKKADIKGMNINDTVDTLIAESERIGYINENGGEVMVSVVPRMRTPKIEDKNKSDNVNLVVSEADKKELDDAKKMGVSIAKAKAIEEYTDAFGGTVSANAGKLGGMTIGQIRNEIDDKKEAQPTPAPATTPSQPAEAKTGTSADSQTGAQISLQSAGTSSPNFSEPQMFAGTPSPNRNNSSQTAQEDKPAEARQETPQPKGAETPKAQTAAEDTHEAKAPDTPDITNAPEAKPSENTTEPAKNNGGGQPEEKMQNEKPQEKVNSQSGDKPQEKAEPAPNDNNAPDSSTPQQNSQPQPRTDAPSGGSPSQGGGSSPAQGGATGGSNAPTGNGGAPSSVGGSPSGGGPR